jgi:hypothetical protein
MSECQWFSCALAARDQSLCRRNSVLQFWASRLKSLRLAVRICHDHNGSFHALLRRCCPSHRIMGACNIAETTRWASFISTFGRFGPTTGCWGRDHMACKLPLKCHSNESRTVAQHTTGATIQGRAGYVQHTQKAPSPRLSLAACASGFNC